MRAPDAYPNPNPNSKNLKTVPKSWLIWLDQVHEQENKLVKGVEGTVGLTQNPIALRYVNKIYLIQGV